MIKLLQSVAVTLGVSLAFGASFAAEIESVNGVVKGVSVSKGYGTLSIIEEGTNEKRTFQVTPDTEFTVRPDIGTKLPLRTTAGYNEVTDLHKGDEVTLKVRQDETDGRWFVVGSSHSEADADVEAQVSDDTSKDNISDTDTFATVELQSDPVIDDSDIVVINTSYTSLPRTATALPMLALGGGLALLAGLGLRARRNRS